MTEQSWIAETVQIVADGFGITPDDIKRPRTRGKTVVRARDAIAYHLRYEIEPAYRPSFVEVAGFVGWRSHAAAVKAVQREYLRRVHGMKPPVGDLPKPYKFDLPAIANKIAGKVDYMAYFACGAD